MPNDSDVAERLQGLETHSAGLEARLTGVERTLTTLIGKFDRFADIITTSAAQPKFNPIEIIAFVKDSAILFSLVAAGIIYIASNISDGKVTLLEHRVTQLESKK